MIEYNPKPPFNTGSPKLIDANRLEKVVSSRKEIQHQPSEQIDRIIAKNNLFSLS